MGKYVKARPDGRYELRDVGGAVLAAGLIYNMITDVGDQWVIESAHGLGDPDPLTGMRLGVGGSGTAPAKTGAGAALAGTYVEGSAKAFTSGPTGAANEDGDGYDAAYAVLWDAGEATADGIDEFVVTNEAPLTDVGGQASDTIARALLDPAVNKGANQTLLITWSHRHNGS